MKAILMRRTGGPSVLEYVDVPTPEPGPGEVLVRAEAIGVNRPEILVRKGIYPWMPPLPLIPGIEMSGTVSSLGEGVTGLAVGQAVLVSARDLPIRGGCYAEFIAVPAGAAHPVPPGCDPDQVACLSNYQVAFLLLERGACGDARSIFVAAASGGIGSALVDLAKAMGKSVIAGVSSPAKSEAVKRLGADHVVLTDDAGWVGHVRALTASNGVDAVFDPIGGAMLSKSFGLLAPLGTVVSYGRLAGGEPDDVHETMARYREVSPAFRLFSMHSFDHAPDVRRGASRSLLELLAARRINPIIHARLPLAEAATAHERMESREVIGKLLLKPLHAG